MKRILLLALIVTVSVVLPAIAPGTASAATFTRYESSASGSWRATTGPIYKAGYTCGGWNLQYSYPDTTKYLMRCYTKTAQYWNAKIIVRT